MISIPPRDLGERGLDAALDRAESSEGLDRLVAVSEALWWLAALDAFHCVSQEDAYVAQRRADPEGHTTGALVWARNRIGPLSELEDVVRAIQEGGDARPPQSWNEAMEVDAAEALRRECLQTLSVALAI